MIDRMARIVRLEAKRPALPMHRPLDLWTDSQLETVLRPGVIESLIDAQLKCLIAEGDNAPIE